MNNAKFSLADLLTLLTALLFGLVCFLGTYFYTLGKTSQSIWLAIIIVGLLCGTALSAKLLKRTNHNFKSFFIWEMVLLVLFTVFLVFFSYWPFTHYFIVSRQKVEIHNKLDASISQAENMFTEYERYAENRENLYKGMLQSVVAAKKTNPSAFVAFGFVNNGVADGKQIENKMFTVHADLFPTNYEDMKQVDSTWLANAKQTLNNRWAWNFGVVDIVNNMEQNSKDWVSKLLKLSAVREKSEPPNDFAYNLSFDDVKTHFTTLGMPTGISIGLSVVAYFLMLLSWFVTKRHTRFPGLNVIFGKEGLSGKNRDEVIL